MKIWFGKAATTLGGLVGVGAITGKAIGVSLLGAGVGTYGAGMGAYAIQQRTSGEQINIGEMFAYGAITSVQGLASFGVGAALGYSGLWTKLTDIQLELFSKTNVMQVALRSYMRFTLVTPFGFIRTAMN